MVNKQAQEGFMQKTKLNFIFYCYTIGAFLVILGHSTPVSQSYVPKIIDDIRTFIYCFHMPLFFFISGFLMAYTKGEKRETYNKFMKKKAIKLLFPYLLFTVIGFFPKLLISEFTNDYVELSIGYFIKTLIAPRDNVWGHLWFLPVLFVFYAFSFLLLRVRKTTFGKIIVTLFMLLILLKPININWLGISDICQFFIYFWLGMLGCECILKFKETLFIAINGVSSFLISIALFIISFYYFKDVYIYSKFFIALLMVFAIFCLSMQIEKTARLKKGFGFFTGKTFAMFLLSWPAQAVVEVLLNRVWNCTWYITVAGMFLAGVLTPLLIVAFIRKFKIKNKWILTCLGIDRV